MEYIIQTIILALCMIAVGALDIISGAIFRWPLLWEIGIGIILIGAICAAVYFFKAVRYAAYSENTADCEDAEQDR